MISREHIGHVMPTFTVEVEKAPLRFFSKATGQSNPIYGDEVAARLAGYPSIVVPPTYLFCLELTQPNPGALRELLSIDIARILHGQQRFRYRAMAFAGCQLTFTQRIDDIYERRGGELEFVVRHTKVVNQQGIDVAELFATTVVRNDLH